MFAEYAAMSLLKTLQPQMKNEYFTSETSDKKLEGILTDLLKVICYLTCLTLLLHAYYTFLSHQ